MTRERPTILVALGAFWPGNDATGPNQSFSALSAALSDEFRFKVVARDRAPGAEQAAAPSGEWRARGAAEARYCRVGRLGAEGLARILRTTEHDVLVLNGFFDREFTIPSLLLRAFRLIPRRPTLLSPRGEFSEGALALSATRKRRYVALARRLGLLSDVHLHATAPSERDEIERAFPWSRGILTASNIRQLSPPPDFEAAAAEDGRVRIAFLSRIDRKKNLDYALCVLRTVKVPVRYDIFGPIRQPDHWAECEALIGTLPPHVEVRYCGPVPNEAVGPTLAGYDLLFLPTRGENFGHAIFDALEVGLPALISDRTPWQALEAQHAGWSLPLERPEGFAAAIEHVAGLDREARAALRRGARRAAEMMVARSDAVEANRRMFRTLLAGGAGRHKP